MSLVGRFARVCLLGCLLVLAVTHMRARLQVPPIALAPLLLAAVVGLQYACGLLPSGANAGNATPWPTVVAVSRVRPLPSNCIK